MNNKNTNKQNKMHIFVGVDIGKRQHVSCFLTEDAKELLYLSFSNSIKGFDKFLKHINKFIKHGYSVSITLEATGHYFLNLYSFLIKHSIDVTVVNPIQTDSFRNVFIRKSKYDKKDAFIIAELARVGRARKSIINDENTIILELKNLTRLRAEYIKRKTNITKKLSSAIDVVFPEFFKVFKSLKSKTPLMLLRNYPSPTKLLNEDKELLFYSVEKWGKKLVPKKKIQKLLELAKNSIGSTLGIDALEIEITCIVDEILFLMEQIKKIEKEIEERSKDIEEIKLLKTIPGIGTVSAASIIGEITSIDKFSSLAKLRAFAGLDPSIKESGTSVKGKSRISKRGSPYLRRTLYYAANSARRSSCVFKEYYERKNAQHPNSKGRYAIVATANKLLTVIYYMLKHREVFDPNYQWEERNHNVFNSNATCTENKKTMLGSIIERS